MITWLGSSLVSKRDNPGGPDADLEALAAYGSALADAVDAVVVPWVMDGSLTAIRNQTDHAAAVDLVAIEEAAQLSRKEVAVGLASLAGQDPDRQSVTPLAVVRSALVHPTKALHVAGVAPVPRDSFSRESFPDDVYNLNPASFRDFGVAVHEASLVWGAAKAHVILARRRAEGLR